MEYEKNKGLMTNGLCLNGWDNWWVNIDKPFDESCPLDGEFKDEKIDEL